MSKKIPKRVSPYFESSKRPASSPIKIQYDKENPPENWSKVYNNIVTMRKEIEWIILNNKTNSWLPDGIPELSVGGQIQRKHQSLTFKVGIEFTVT